MLNSIVKSKELLRRIIITIMILILAQFVTNIPTPGINKELISSFLSSDIGESMGFFSLFSGNSLSNMSMFMLGVSPFITASIVLQLLRVAFPKLDEMAKDGKAGQDKYKRLNYICGAIFSIIQAFPVAYGFKRSGILVENNNKYALLVSVFLIIGSVGFMLMGAAIDKWGIKNGISLILMTNIVSRIPQDIATIYDMYMRGHKIGYWILTILIVIAISVGLTIWTIYLQDGEKRIPTQYSGHISSFNHGTKGNSSYIPLKVNVAGVMPIIFTMNMFQLYTLAVSLAGVDSNSILRKIAYSLTTSRWFDKNAPIYTLGLLLYIVLLFAFQYFYSIIQFDTEKIAQNLKNQGGVVVGIRPGKPTEEYLNKKLKSMTIVGSVLLFVVAIIPIIVAGIFNIHSLSLGGTSIIIIVGVLVETHKQIESECLQNSQTSSFLF